MRSIVKPMHERVQEVQGPRSEVRGLRSEVQGPRSEVQGLGPRSNCKPTNIAGRRLPHDGELVAPGAESNGKCSAESDMPHHAMQTLNPASSTNKALPLTSPPIPHPLHTNPPENAMRSAPTPCNDPITLFSDSLSALPMCLPLLLPFAPFHVLPTHCHLDVAPCMQSNRSREREREPEVDK